MTDDPQALPFLPYGRQDIDEADIDAVAAVLRSDYLTTGPAVEAFEADFAQSVGARHAVSCSSGTAGLHLAAIALGLGPGDAVIVPAITFVATANAARYVGAEVVFCDVDPQTGLARPADVEAAIARAGDKARAIFIVHVNGQTADMETLADLARRHGVTLVEDACHALGGDYRIGAADARRGQPGDCALSAMAVFSMHPVKAIAMGEGGVITTNDDELAARLRLARNHGITRDPRSFSIAELAFDADGAPNPWYYEMAAPGYNYRASDIHCALGASQLRRLDAFIAKRRALADTYDRLLAPLAPVVRPIARAPWSHSAFHLYVVLIDYADAGMSRAALMRALHAHGIGSQVHYLPVNRQPYYAERGDQTFFPGADAYYARCLSLPLYPALGDADIARVVDTLAACLGNRPG